MQQLLAITWLTWKAAFRFRLFLVVAVLLLLSVVGLPLLIKDDGTARGFTQIVLTYTLSAITGLLGLSTLWLACGTLARDVEECQVQMVAVKPISRWQIWLGKWLGIMSLNAALLFIAGLGVYGLLFYRSNQLSPGEQRILRAEVLVARAGAKEDVDALLKDIRSDAEKVLQDRLKKDPMTRADLTLVRRQILEQVKAQYQLVPPQYGRTWKIHLGSDVQSLRDKPLQLRIKFNAADNSTSGTYAGLWEIGAASESNPPRRLAPMSLAPDTFHEFEIPPNMFDDKGVLTINFVNGNETALLFPLEDGMEVLYPESGFKVNFLRALGVIFCWMALLATLGLSAASVLSFPVAAFVSLGALIMCLGSGTMSSAVENGTVMGVDEETGKAGSFFLDKPMVHAFAGIVWVIKLAKDFSPIESVSTGRSVTWEQLGFAFVQIVVVLGGILAAIGIFLFSRRELATAQGNQ
jgi:hypothetical protein